MTRLPRGLPARKVMQALSKHGFIIHHHTGGHAILKHETTGRRCVVPQHRSIDTGTLLSILKQARVSRKEFLAALR